MTSPGGIVRGRTARRRTKEVIRSGAEALEEAANKKKILSQQSTAGASESGESTFSLSSWREERRRKEKEEEVTSSMKEGSMKGLMREAACGLPNYNESIITGIKMTPPETEALTGGIKETQSSSTLSSKSSLTTATITSTAGLFGRRHKRPRTARGGPLPGCYARLSSADIDDNLNDDDDTKFGFLASSPPSSSSSKSTFNNNNTAEITTPDSPSRASRHASSILTLLDDSLFDVGRKKQQQQRQQQQESYTRVKSTASAARRENDVGEGSSSISGSTNSSRKGLNDDLDDNSSIRSTTSIVDTREKRRHKLYKANKKHTPQSLVSKGLGRIDEYSSVASHSVAASPSTTQSITDSSSEQKRSKSYSRSYAITTTTTTTKTGGTPDSTTSNTPIVAIGGHGSRGGTTTVQDVGNFRMLIDDLSYLCSAIVQCRKREGDGSSSSVMIKHTAITAGAACGVAELISQSTMRTKLLSVFARTSKMGTIEAILESIACAPNNKLGENIFLSCRAYINGDPRSCDDNVTACNAGLVIDPISDMSKNQGGEYHDAIAFKALAISSYFIGVGCTESDKSNPRGSRLAAQSVRECVLQHKAALLGISRIVANDPFVHAYLLHETPGTKDIVDNRKGLINSSASQGGVSSQADLLPVRHDIPSKPVPRKMNPSTISMKFSAPLHDGEQQSLSTANDPTKHGRKSRKRKAAPLHEDSPSGFSFGESPMNPFLNNPQLSPVKSKGEFNDDSSVLSHECQNMDNTNDVDKFDEMISLAMSRTSLTHENNFGIPYIKSDIASTCTFCAHWSSLLLISNVGPTGKEKCYSVTSSSLAVAAAYCIITGQDKSTSDDVNDIVDDDDDIDDDDDFLGRQRSQMSENPIVYANEMIRLSGALPYYSRSMSESLAAILLSNTAKICPTCIAYLQDRASSLSEVIDSLCCLSPKVSKTLSHHESFLVPSLLRTVAELSFGIDYDRSYVYFESISTALKTLTSLTHENSSACDQLRHVHHWNILLPTSSRESSFSSHISGLDIIFNYLFKTATLKQTRNAHQQKMDYDNTIFCLNIMTNMVEMAPSETRSMFEKIVVNEWPGLTWLTRWVVSKTLRFQDSLMKGSFGSSTCTTDAGTGLVECSDSGLESGEEENLVTTGNGFVLLAYLIVEECDSPSSSWTSSSQGLRDCILKELPTNDEDGESGGIQFIIKVLKAFCNFYHYSVGDLSVAVIAPVVKLITGLEKMNIIHTEQDTS